jgi:ferric-dicitrate binding protein FerR (iron transport regulator)
MKKENDIQHLLKKLSEDELAPHEAMRLNSILKNKDTDAELNEVLGNLWQNSEVGNIPSNQMWDRIQKEIPASTVIEDISLTKRIRPYLKYAAVAIITVGLTLLIQNRTSKTSIAVASSDNKETSEITVSYGSKSKVTLPDGSVVNLNSGSTLRYPAKFNRSSRNVYLEGEAFFDVKKDPQHPFYVKTDVITIKVLGTKFNVKSYADENTIQTTLVSGAVEIYSNKKGLSEKDRLLALVPNQRAIIEKENEHTAVIDNRKKKNMISLDTIIAKSQLEEAVAWKDNKLVFRDETFHDLSKKMERWYDVEIEIVDENLPNALFSGVFVKESVEQALDALKLATPFQYKMEKNYIIISK